MKDFLQELSPPALNYSCSTKSEGHSEGEKENNRIQSEKMIFNMFNKANESSLRPSKMLPVVESELKKKLEQLVFHTKDH